MISIMVFDVGIVCVIEWHTPLRVFTT